MTVKAEMFCFVSDVSDQEHSLGMDSQMEHAKKEKWMGGPTVVIIRSEH